jgi:hypothetical protein
MQQSFTCCVGTGMESHALHGDNVYAESDDTVWVNLFVPSTAELAVGNIAMETSFPDGDSAKLTFSLPKSREFTLAIRRPSWAGDGFTVKVNGAAVEQPPLASLRAGAAGGRNMHEDDHGVPQPSTFVELKRTWKSGDVVELTLPKTVRLETTPDNKSVAAIMWGPLVLAGDLGPRREGRVTASAAPPVPVLVTAERPVAQWVVPDSVEGNFRASQVARIAGQNASPTDVSLTPFYRTHRRTYSVYFDVLTQGEFDARGAAISAEREHQRRVEAATISYIQPGDAQPEQEYSYHSEPADRRAERTNGRGSRSGAGWFSYDLPVDPQADMAVLVTYFNELGLPPAAGNFEIQIEGKRIAQFSPNASATGFYDAQYAIPADLTRGKARVTVKFAGVGNGRIAPVFGVRMIKAAY